MAYKPVAFAHDSPWETGNTKHIKYSLADYGFSEVFKDSVKELGAYQKQSNF